MPRYHDRRLRAGERLKARAAIDALFRRATPAPADHGTQALGYSGGPTSSVKAYPLRLVYRELPPDPALPPARVGVVASKRTFKRAPDRNHVKRRIREAYRYRKTALYEWLEHRGYRLDGMILFTGRDLPTQRDIHRAWTKLLRRLDPEWFA